MSDRPGFQINPSQPVLVTGATGYVASWIVERLLAAGARVHAAVRDPANTDKRRYLDALAEKAPGELEYFRSELLTEGSYSRAMEGCGLVFHTASPFTLDVADPIRDLIQPALLGTRNVLEQANRTDSVSRVVVTSSCAAIYSDNADIELVEGDRFTEEHWNTTSSPTHQAYSHSKTLAEKEAWSIAGAQDHWSLVTINPSLVLGPGVNPFSTSESQTLIRRFADGTMKSGVPNFGIGAVDVRDVADAHVRAGYLPAANGRYVVSGHDTSFPEIGKILRDHFGDRYPFPRKTMPKWLVWLLGPIFDKSLSRKMVTRNVDVPWHADNGKSRRELGMSYRPLQTSVVEMFQQLIDAGIL